MILGDRYPSIRANQVRLDHENLTSGFHLRLKFPPRLSRDPNSFDPLGEWSAHANKLCLSEISFFRDSSRNGSMGLRWWPKCWQLKAITLRYILWRFKNGRENRLGKREKGGVVNEFLWALRESLQSSGHCSLTKSIGKHLLVLDIDCCTLEGMLQDFWFEEHPPGFFLNPCLFSCVANHMVENTCCVGICLCGWRLLWCYDVRTAQFITLAMSFQGIRICVCIRDVDINEAKITASSAGIICWLTSSSDHGKSSDQYYSFMRKADRCAIRIPGP